MTSKRKHQILAMLGRRHEEPQRSKAPCKSGLSNTQLRRRLSRSGLPLSMVTGVVHEARAIKCLKPGVVVGRRYCGPLEQALIATIGEHATRRVMVGVREPMIVWDDYWSLVGLMPSLGRVQVSLPRRVEHLEVASA